MEPNPSQAEAKRLLGIAEKLLQAKDFNGCRDCAVLAQETDPLVDGPNQILTVADILIASQERIKGHQDYYSLLQIDHNRHDLDLVKKHYCHLTFLLHPDKNCFPFSDAAFRLAAEDWAILSDAVKKLSFNNELNPSPPEQRGAGPEAAAEKEQVQMLLFLLSDIREFVPKS